MTARASTPRHDAARSPSSPGSPTPTTMPTDAEVVIDTTGRSIEDCVDDVYDALVRLGAVAPSTRAR